MIRRKLLAVALLVMGVLLWVFLPSGKNNCSRPLRLMTFNVNGLHSESGTFSLPLVQSVIALERPDLLCLQEFPTAARKRAAKFARELGFKYHVFKSQYRAGSRIGLAFFSRFPLVRDTVVLLDPPAERRYAQVVEVVFQNKHFRVVNTHFSNRDFRRGRYDWRFIIRELRGENLRTLQVGSLLKYLENAPPLPTVLAGDFNTFVFSSAYRRMAKLLDDATPFWQMFRPTYTKQFRARIDHVFTSSDVGVCASRTVSTVSSDHNPVVVEFCLPR